MEVSRLRAEIQVPNHIVVPRNRKTVKIDLVALIHNDGDDHYVVGAANASQIASWMILDEDSNVVARSGSRGRTPAGVTSAYRSTLVPCRLSIREHKTLVVRSEDLKHGRRYVARHTHWGHTDEAQFVVVHEPERAALAKKPKAKKRKAAGKPKRRPAVMKAKPKTSGKPAARKKTVKKAKQQARRR